MARMLRSIAPPSASPRRGERPAVAFALGVVDGDHVGLFDVLVTPQARRRGLARRSPEHRSLGRSTARALPICRSWHQRGRLPLYADLGFETVYSYAYRVP
jgi:GNAT superfamily N-acetyltransferase